MSLALNNSNLIKNPGKVKLVTLTVDDTNETNRFFSNFFASNFQKNHSTGIINTGQNKTAMRLMIINCSSIPACEDNKEDRSLTRTTSSDSNSSSYDTQSSDSNRRNNVSDTL